MTKITDQSGHSATVAQTQGPQGTVSTVVLEDEKKILVALKELRDRLSHYAPQLLNVFKIKSLPTLVAENFSSEMRAGSYDMPLQLQIDFWFSRALKKHLKQMCRTKFCYSTSAKSYYPKVQFVKSIQIYQRCSHPHQYIHLSSLRCNKWETGA